MYNIVFCMSREETNTKYKSISFTTGGPKIGTAYFLGHSLCINKVLVGTNNDWLVSPDNSEYLNTFRVRSLFLTNIVRKFTQQVTKR
jgi:hypothetical protein